MRFQQQERGIMISEIWFTENRGALEEELKEVYAANLTRELIATDDPEKTIELRAKIRGVNEVLQHLATVVERSGKAPEPKGKIKDGY